MEWSKWRSMWVVVLFDLPTETEAHRRNYRLFRGALLDDGFHMMQYSCYIRDCPSEENAAVHDERVRTAIPPEGQVRILHLTDAQFARMKIYEGGFFKEPEEKGEQLEIF